MEYFGRAGEGVEAHPLWPAIDQCILVAMSPGSPHRTMTEPDAPARRGSRPLAVRLAAEAAVIFASVVLALAADDWRQTREEREEARESLAVVLTDLREDSLQMAATEATARRHIRDTRWLAERWDSPSVNVDSAEAVFRSIISGDRLEWRSAGFEGLQGSNRLRLIRSNEVREGLLQYYEVRLRSMVLMYELAFESSVRFYRETAAPHVVLQIDGGVRLARPWSEITRDRILRNGVVWQNYLSRGLLYELTEGQREVGALMAAIREQLSE